MATTHDLANAVVVAADGLQARLGFRFDQQRGRVSAADLFGDDGAGVGNRFSSLFLDAVSKSTGSRVIFRVNPDGEVRATTRTHTDRAVGRLNTEAAVLGDAHFAVGGDFTLNRQSGPEVFRVQSVTGPWISGSVGSVTGMLARADGRVDNTPIEFQRGFGTTLDVS